jgi:hypothetical protein
MLGVDEKIHANFANIYSVRFDVSENDLRVIAAHGYEGYEGAAGTNHDQQAHAIALFLSDAVMQLDVG